MPPAIARNPKTAAAATITLALGIVFVIKSVLGVPLFTVDQQGNLSVKGNVSASGSYYANGVLVSGGSNLTAGQGLTLNGTSLRLNSTVTGSTISGALLVGPLARITRGIELFSSGSTVQTGSGVDFIAINDPTASGYLLTSVYATVQTAGVTNPTKIQIRNAAKANRKLLSTPVQIDSNETDSATSGTPAVINAANRDVGYRDRLFFDIPSVSSTPPKVLQVYLIFSHP